MQDSLYFFSTETKYNILTMLVKIFDTIKPIRDTPHQYAQILAVHRISVRAIFCQYFDLCYFDLTPPLL